MDGLNQNIAFTKVPNILLDRYLPNLSGSELTILLIICRKTFGFHKTKDRIALSTMVSLTGMTKTTVIQSIRNLVEQGIVLKIETTMLHSYCIEPSIIERKTGIKNGVQKSNLGIENEPSGVQKSDSIGVQNLDPQKSTLKEREKNSSTTISNVVLKVIDGWNTRFKSKIKNSETSIISYIQIALNHYSVDEVIRAMDNRLVAKYYKEKKPDLLHEPKCFFPYLKTIQCDLNRVPENLYTYEEHLKVMHEKGYHGDDFVIRKDITDKNGNPMRELKRTAVS